MSELMTMKELTEEQLSVYEDMHERSHCRVFEKRTRKEAIKWIKNIRTNKKINFKTEDKFELTAEYGSASNQDIVLLTYWIKHFFNLTEEDLK